MMRMPIIRLENLGLCSYSDDSRCSFVMDYWDNRRTDWLSSSTTRAWFLPGSLMFLCCAVCLHHFYRRESMSRIDADKNPLWLVADAKFILIHVPGNFHFYITKHQIFPLLRLYIYLTVGLFFNYYFSFRWWCHTVGFVRVAWVDV